MLFQDILPFQAFLSKGSWSVLKKSSNYRTIICWNFFKP